MPHIHVNAGVCEKMFGSIYLTDDILPLLLMKQTFSKLLGDLMSIKYTIGDTTLKTNYLVYQERRIKPLSCIQ